MPETILAVENLTVAYGKVKAVRDITFSAARGAVTSLVGANGAGKTTCLLALSGLIPKAQGRVTFMGEDISRLPPHRIVQRGMVQVAEGRATLTSLSVRENLELGAYAPRSGAAERRRAMEQVFDLFPRLLERLDAAAGSLSGGEQQMLAMGRALMARPRLLLLDEPSMGLAPLVVQDIFRTIERINRSGVSVLMVEQNVRQALQLAQQAYVLETGSIALRGTGSELLSDGRVKDIYLGV